MRGIGRVGVETFLGDGLFASFDGESVALRAPRPPGPDHVVFLNAEVLDAFMTWLDCCIDRGDTHGNA